MFFSVTAVRNAAQVSNRTFDIVSFSFFFFFMAHAHAAAAALALRRFLQLLCALKAANEPESSVTMVVVLAAPGALLIAIIALAAILAFYHKKKKNLRHQSSQHHSQSGVQSRDGDDANDDANYAQTKNGKQPDLIKSKRGNINIPYTDRWSVTFTVKRELMVEFLIVSLLS